MSTTASEQHIEDARQRLQRSREQIFAFVQALRGDHSSPGDGAGDGAFPRSRLMRALAGNTGRMLFGGAALAATAMRPSLLWRATKLGGLLRPLLLRYVLPRLLR